MKKKKEVTIYDLAKELNYSPSTISRALNNHSSISKKATKEIQKVAEKLGYRPNSIAASLRNNKSKTIGIMISRINRPFISSLISGIEEVAREAGYNVLISQSNDIYENEISNAKALYESRIAGLIVSLGMETKNTDHFKLFTDKNIPLVFVDRVPDEFNSYRVIIDNYSAGFRATQHLIDQGCKRIAHFAGAQHLNVYRLRKNGYLDALQKNGLEIDEDLIMDLETLSFEEGQAATEKLLEMKNPPDGLFASNDTSAVSAILCAKEQGIKIPKDLAIIGFNDDPMASIVEPALSTVSHPAMQMGRFSAQKILEHSTGQLNSGIAQITILDTEVIVRRSSNRLGAGKKSVETAKNLLKEVK